MRCDPRAGEPLPRVLVVEDNDLERMLIRQRLRSDPIELFEAATGAAAIELARSVAPDLILLDLDLPDVSGFDVIHQLKEDPATRSIPVIFVSAYGSTESKVRALDLGAIDFVTKPFDPAELRARLRVAFRLKFQQDLLEKQAHLDSLTGLANRLAMRERLDAEWSACRRRGTPLSLLIADVDHFKRINDRYGHAAGDEALRRVAEALRAVARASDLVARFGGEEFVLIAPDCDLAGALGLAERAREQVEGLRLMFDATAHALTASVGAATSPAELPVEASAPETPDDLLNRADRALYEAKSSGRNAVWAWDTDLSRPSPGGTFRAVTG
jgi:diguanylate cyclase (GGDEF)-like protein